MVHGHSMRVAWVGGLRGITPRAPSLTSQEPYVETRPPRRDVGKLAGAILG
jgi:hypothetical protein